MIFASDLDQTLIYSINFLNKHYKNHTKLREESLTLIEYYNGEPLSYIHNEVINHIQEFDQIGYFIPVTTRTEEQYKRIEFFKFNIRPTFAITTNGAKVLKNGEIDPEWENQINLKLNSISLENERVIEIIQKIIPNKCIKKIRTAENVFTYLVLYRDLFDVNLLPIIESKLGIDWNISLQGTKLYLMPQIVSKWNALEYVSSKLNHEKIIAAGDSLLDIPLLENSDLGVIPSHGEIYDRELHLKYGFEVAEFEKVNASVGITNLVFKHSGLL